MQDSRVILDQNGAEGLTPPGQAIFVRGMETITVMTPYLSDDERAQRMNALRVGKIELTELEKKTLLAVKSLMQEGKKPTVHGVYNQLRGQVTLHQATEIMRNLRLASQGEAVFKIDPLR
jgi:DNA segregation ATPase FtsK/SpoIIIE-like protein